MNKNTLTTYEIAHFCQVTPRTVIQWINEGKLKAYRTPGNHSRVSIEDFMNFLYRYNMPVPDHLIHHAVRGKRRILIVDDDKSVVHIIRSLLAKEEIYELAHAYDGFDAGRKFIEFKPHLIILDLNMPVINGYQVCESIRQGANNQDVKILIASASHGEAGIQKALALGANDYLFKPFNGDEMMMKITGLLGKTTAKGKRGK